MTSIQRDTICYRLLLSIGDSLELNPMLGRSLTAYMRELSCSMGAVLLKHIERGESVTLSCARSIPRQLERHKPFRNLLDELSSAELEYEDVMIREAQQGRYYIFSLADAGLLVLYAREQLDTTLLRQLGPVNQKLGTACLFCQQNTLQQENSQRFMEMADMLPGIILECSSDYRITFFNHRTQDIFKQIDSHKFDPHSLFDFFPEQEHRKLKMLLACLELGDPTASRDIEMRNSRGDLFKVNLHLSPIYASDTITGFRGIAIDISERVKLEKNLIARDKLLHAITVSTQHLLKSKRFTESVPTALKLLGESMDVDRVYYFSTTLDAEGTPVTVSQRGEWSKENVEPQIDNPDLQDVPAEMVDLFLTPLQEKKPFRTLIRDLKESVTKELLEAQQIVSILVLPIFVKEQFWGFVGFDDCQSERTWTDLEQDLLQLFSISISEAIERDSAEDEIRRLYRNLMDDLDTAQSVQSFILPPWCLADPRLLFASQYVPCEKVGGDLYDCLKVSDTRYVIYAADISGHGIQAALGMTAVKSIISMITANCDECGHPERVLTRLNQFLSEHLFEENYMTMCYCYADLDAMTVSFLHAGHPPAAVVGGDGTVSILDSSGDIPLGWIDNYQYKPSAVIHRQMSEDDIICLYTDGVYDCTNAEGSRLGLEQFHQVLSDLSCDPHCTTLPFKCYLNIQERGYELIEDDFSFITFQMIPEDQRCPVFRAVAADLYRMDAAVSDAESFLLQQDVCDVVVLKAKVVMQEFLSNVFLHGLAANYHSPVYVEIQTGEELSLVFRDQGKPWDLPAVEQSPDQFFDALNEQLMHSGRGLQMIYAMTSSRSRRRIHQINETQFIISAE